MHQLIHRHNLKTKWPTVTGSLQAYKDFENPPTEYLHKFYSAFSDKRKCKVFQRKKMYQETSSGEEGVHDWGKGKIRLTWVIEMIQAGKLLGLLLASSEIIQ